MPSTPRQLMREYAAARRRSERAHWYGDRAGELIAAADARRIRIQLENGAER